MNESLLVFAGFGIGFYLFALYNGDKKRGYENVKEIRTFE